MKRRNEKKRWRRQTTDISRKEQSFRQIISEEVRKALKPYGKEDAEYEAIRRNGFAASSRYYRGVLERKRAAGEIDEFRDPYQPPESVIRTFGRTLTDGEEDFRRHCAEIIGPDHVPQQTPDPPQYQPELDWAQPPEGSRQRPQKKLFPQPISKSNKKTTPAANPGLQYGARDRRDPTTWSFPDASSTITITAPPKHGQRVIEVEEGSSQATHQEVYAQEECARMEYAQEECAEESSSVDEEEDEEEYGWQDLDDHDGYDS